MSIETAGSETATKELLRSSSKSAMRRYILNNPEFVLDDSEMCEAITSLAGRRYGDNVISMQTAVMARMRQRLRVIEIEREEMLDAAEDNLLGMNQINDAILQMLEARDFAEFLEIVGGRFAELLCVDSVLLCVETAPRRGEAQPSGIDVLRPIAPGSVERFFDDAAWGIAMRAAAVETAALHTSEGIESEALVRLDFGSDSRPGVLLFGSCDPNRFHEDQGGDLLLFLGGAVSRVMRYWLDEPSAD